ncbi:hypothetical protein JDV02_009927 [Purpureocillium takamizusanense]|uniref:Pre-mRNA-splicing factor 38B n=1 Tax=Purpureocillium takamizusanense TaxID=2060973 RepID=A0A9Q8VEQ3_9HYPO|nr:uncharacterized protein JDV02_009927 [Purpureocillium takamizusanense]UNI24155.1 hypothetical protein JDV02_009927 [Purpureocillium takamizusanense]
MTAAGQRDAERAKEKEPQPTRAESSRSTRKPSRAAGEPTLRRRQMDGIRAILGGASRDPVPSRHHGERRGGDSTTRHGGSILRGGDHPKRHDRLIEHRHPSRDDELTSRRSRHDTHISGEERPCHHTTSRRSRSRSPRRRRSRSPERSRRRRDRSSSPRSKRASRQPAAASSDSDHENFGPAPPPTFKGRGTIGGAADLDRRFSSSYDPKMDVDPGSDGGDWDDTVEAYRDRLKLKQNQERRMRDAGFPEDQIRKMTQGEKTDKDVVWGKAGEKRDWDRGKDEGDTQPPTLFSEDYDG